MPDITMCANKKCPLRGMCYRYRAIPDRHQAFAIFEPKLTATESNGAACDSFWNCKGYKLRPTEEADNQKTPFDKEQEATQRKATCAAPGAKYPTGIVIDLKSPQGNVFYLIGLANKLGRELGLSAEEMAEFKRDLASATTYHAHLSLLRAWFGAVFVG